MDDETKKIIKEHFKVIPKDVQDAITSIDLSTKLKKITKRKVEISPDTVNGRKLFRVRIGPIASVSQADVLSAKLKKAGFNLAMPVIEFS